MAGTILWSLIAPAIFAIAVGSAVPANVAEKRNKSASASSGKVYMRQLQ